MFTENKHTRHFATRKNSQSQLVTDRCSLLPTRKVKGLARNTKCSHSHKILVALRRHKFTQYFVSGLALCGRMNSLPWLNTRSTEAEVEVMHKQQRGV